MNADINDVITANVLLAKIPVQRKGQTGYRPVYPVTSAWCRVGEKSGCNFISTQSFKVQPGIFGYIGQIIHVPGAIEGVAVNQENRCQQQQ